MEPAWFPASAAAAMEWAAAVLAPSGLPARCGELALPVPREGCAAGGENRSANHLESERDVARATSISRSAIPVRSRPFCVERAVQTQQVRRDRVRKRGEGARVP